MFQVQQLPEGGAAWEKHFKNMIVEGFLAVDIISVVLLSPSPCCHSPVPWLSLLLGLRLLLRLRFCQPACLSKCLLWAQLHKNTPLALCTWLLFCFCRNVTVHISMHYHKQHLQYICLYVYTVFSGLCTMRLMWRCGFSLDLSSNTRGLFRRKSKLEEKVLRVTSSHKSFWKEIVLNSHSFCFYLPH